MDAVEFHGLSARKYDKSFASKRSAANRLQTWRRVLQRLVTPGMKVLDLGCGTGQLTEVCLHLGGEVVAIDGSAEMLAVARARVRNRERVVLIHRRIEQLDMESFGEFDLVVASSLFEYVPESPATLASLRHSLSDGGRLLISLPDARTVYRSCESFMFRITGHPEYRRHVSYFQSRSQNIADLLGAGYQILETHALRSFPKRRTALAANVGFRTLDLFVCSDASEEAIP